MIIETERLILRPFLETDANDIYEYLHKPSVNCFACMTLKTLDDAKAEILNRIDEIDYYFAITLKESGKVIGEIDAYPETGEPHADENSPRDTFSPCWMLNEAYQGMGYAYEAAYAFFDYLFMQKGARRIYAYTEDYNFSCQRLCEKLGMRREGFFREFVSFVNAPDGAPLYENTMQYAILKREWEDAKRMIRKTSSGSVTLARLNNDDREQFILDNQYAFKYGISVDFPPHGEELHEDFDGEIISRETIAASIDNGVAYRIQEHGQNVGGMVLNFNREYGKGDLELLFVTPDAHSKGIGFAAWQEVERLYPEIKVWQTETPSFETRNIHFYVNKCGFHIVEFYNSKHPDPHDPETGEECYEDTDGGMFRFEKVMSR